jgi:molecular chaperone DnaK
LKEQSIRITASSGLSEQEIQNLIKDAELHAEEDKRRRELVDARNMADSLIYSTEKSIKELGDKVDASTKGDVDQAIEKLKKAMEGENTQEIKRLSDELTQTSHKIAEMMYSRASQQQAHPGAGGGGPQGGASKKDEDVVDADFEEVKK